MPYRVEYLITAKILNVTFRCYCYSIHWIRIKKTTEDRNGATSFKRSNIMTTLRLRAKRCFHIPRIRKKMCVTKWRCSVNVCYRYASCKAKQFWSLNKSFHAESAENSTNNSNNFAQVFLFTTGERQKKRRMTANDIWKINKQLGMATFFSAPHFWKGFICTFETMGCRTDQCALTTNIQSYFELWHRILLLFFLNKNAVSSRTDGELDRVRHGR